MTIEYRFPTAGILWYYILTTVHWTGKWQKTGGVLRKTLNHIKIGNNTGFVLFPHTSPRAWLYTCSQAGKAGKSIPARPLPCQIWQRFIVFVMEWLFIIMKPINFLPVDKVIHGKRRTDSILDGVIRQGRLNDGSSV
jgi:hypothetical protein